MGIAGSSMVASLSPVCTLFKLTWNSIAVLRKPGFKVNQNRCLLTIKHSSIYSGNSEAEQLAKKTYLWHVRGGKTAQGKSVSHPKPYFDLVKASYVVHSQLLMLNWPLDKSDLQTYSQHINFRFYFKKWKIRPVKELWVLPFTNISFLIIYLIYFTAHILKFWKFPLNFELKPHTKIGI